MINGVDFCKPISTSIIYGMLGIRANLSTLVHAKLLELEYGLARCGDSALLGRD